MSAASERLAAMKKMTPKTGYAVVGVDDYETDPEGELYPCGTFPTREAADREARSLRKKGHRVVVLGP